MKLSIKKLLSAILLLVCIGSAAMYALSAIDKQKSEASYKSAESVASLPMEEAPTEAPTEAVAEAQTEPTEPAKTKWAPAPVTDDDPYLQTLSHINLAALRQVNPDVVGWIRIPGMKIHYPIMRSDDNDYYLNHTWDGQSSFSGSIFLETANSVEFTDFNTIVYGHNMKNGSMFAGLHAYTTLSHWSQNPYVYLVTDAGVLRYEIFASYDADVDSKAYGLSFRKTQTREEFIQLAIENSDIDTGLVPAATDRILTLSTCTGLGYQQRRVVHTYLPMELQ